jgi:hypothetical protein
LADHVKNSKVHLDGDESAQDERIAKYFREVHFGHMDEPAVIVDCHGHIITWYLPGILTQVWVVIQIHILLPT